MHDFLVFMFGFMFLYKSCVEVVFGMSVENFTSELLKTWSLHLGGVLINFILQVFKLINFKMKQRFLLHLDGDLGCRHDIGMTSWKLHLDGEQQIFSTQA